jgi:hypothetical protein
MGKKKPDTLALVVGHVVVGVAATWLTAKIAKSIGPSILLGVVAVILHAALDAPVSQVASDLGL